MKRPVSRSMAINYNRAIEDAANLVKDFAKAYPEDIFPPDGTSIDCKSAKFARHISNFLYLDILKLKIKREQ